jgi:hypothetical protein
MRQRPPGTRLCTKEWCRQADLNPDNVSEMLLPEGGRPPWDWDTKVDVDFVIYLPLPTTREDCSDIRRQVVLVMLTELAPTPYHLDLDGRLG